MTATIPLQALPNQTMTVTLGTQQCRLTFFQNSEILCATIEVNSVVLISSVACCNRVPIIRHPYLGFVGTLAFIDTMGANDPHYSGLGTRYKLVYLP